MKNGINFHHPALLSADRESKQQPTSRFQPIKNAFWGTTEHQAAARARARTHVCAAAEPRSCRSPQMIRLLRCIGRKLCRTSILQHPREPRPLAGKCSRSRRATTEGDERVSSPTKESVDTFNLKAGGEKKREENGPRTYTTTFVWSVIVHGNKPNGIVE